MPVSIGRRGTVWLAIATGAVAMVAGCSSGTSGSGASSSPAADASTVIATSAAPAPALATTSTTVAITPVAVAATTGVPTTAVPTTALPTAAVPTTVGIEPGALLQQALATLTGTYHFTSTASVNGAVAIVADGDRVGDGSRFTVTANDATVGYVITTDGTWVQQPGAAWEQIDDPPATADPIEALRAPSAVVMASTDGTTSHLSITVPGTSLGLAGDGGVTVQATVVSGALASVGYETTVGDAPAVVTSTFAPAADPSPVVAPA